MLMYKESKQKKLINSLSALSILSLSTLSSSPNPSSSSILFLSTTENPKNMNYDRVSATIGIRAVDPRILADDKFLKRMGNFDRVCKQIDAKHDHVMEMLADIQEQLRKLERKQRKETGVNFCVGDAQSQTQSLLADPSSKPNLMISDSASHSQKIKNVNLPSCEETQTNQPIPPSSTLVSSAPSSSAHAPLESNFTLESTLSPPLQHPHLLSRLSSTAFSLPAIETLTITTNPKPQNLSRVVVKPTASAPKIYHESGALPATRDKIEEIPESYLGASNIEKIETDLVEISSGFSSNTWSEWKKIKNLAGGANDCEQNPCIEKVIAGGLQIQELVHCVSLYMMSFSCLAFAYDSGICCMCWNESLVYISEILLNNFVAANLKVGLHGVKVLKNVSVFHHSLVNPTVGLEDAIPLQEINSLHTAEGGQVDQDLMSALKEFGLAKFHFTANGFGNDTLHCFKVYFKPNKLLLNCEINNVVHSWSICHQDMFQNSATFVRVEGCLYQCLISLIRVDSTKYSDIEHYIHECGGVGRFRKTVGRYKEKKNMEATLVFDPGDLDFFSLNIGDNSVEVVIFGGISIAFSSWHIVSRFYFYYQGSESNDYNYHSLGDVNVQQNCAAVFVGEAVEFEVVSIEVVTWGKKVGGSECPENQRNESGGLIASLWTLEINFELIVFELVVVATECQIFEAKLQVKTTTKSSLELDLTNEKQRLNCRLVLEDGFVCAAVFEAYGCPSKMFDRLPLKPPFQFRHLSLEDKTHSRGEYCHVHGYGEKRWSLWGNWDSIPNLIWGIDSADSG